MEKKYWSGYAKYLVLSDNSSNKFKGTFIHYQDFLIVKNVINNIAFSDKSTYSYDGDIYRRKITSTEAKNILDNINKCKWTDVTSRLLIVASQLKLKICC
jgi:hypothetical protein|tara:strand:+ start:61 stop:360 length:300 start_codon:yes stop_codon:yes gene_type:complete